MPPLDAETLALLQYLMSSMGGGGVSMEPDTAMLMSSLVQPNLNKYGEPEVYDVDAQAKATNQLQNVYSSLADPMNAFMSGIGSFGASPLGGGIAGGGGLNPITTESILETPNTLQTQYLAQLFEGGQPGQRSVEGLVASKLLAGQDPSLIMTDLQAKLANPEASGLDANEAALFKNSLPQKDVLDPAGNPSGETTIDWNATRKWIEDRAQPYLQEQAQLLGPNVTRNSYGQYVSLSEKPSPQMEWLQKMGLPDPRAQYGKDFALQSSPELQAMMGTIAQTGQAYEEAQNAYKKFLRQNPMAEALINERKELEKRRTDKYKSTLIDYNRSLADWAREQAGAQPTAAVVAPRTSQEEGPPGWLGKVGGAIGDVVSGTPGYINDMLGAAHPRPISPNPMGYGGVNLLPEPQRPTPPTMPAMPGRSMMEMLLGNIRQAPIGTSGKLFNQMNRQRKAAGADVLATAAIMAPMFGASRAGRTPFKDAMLQRLQPLFAVGGAG